MIEFQAKTGRILTQHRPLKQLAGRLVELCFQIHKVQIFESEDFNV